ncbi:hypothetical protein N658DRAFT_54590 [Parathielavia hyrcaniae]|uniref:Uncharacterized protein n=1 Tax=Parathielavia hyrcaniae TaxID=113614 RepID=A0AAN6Q6Q1_9PEZI|nr:hypothetical protein N658DRAFT_54590 [Parathielavia hyrcaniae]
MFGGVLSGCRRKQNARKGPPRETEKVKEDLEVVTACCPGFSIDTTNRLIICQTLTKPQNSPHACLCSPRQAARESLFLATSCSGANGSGGPSLGCSPSPSFPSLHHITDRARLSSSGSLFSRCTSHSCQQPRYLPWEVGGYLKRAGPPTSVLSHHPGCQGAVLSGRLVSSRLGYRFTYPRSYPYGLPTRRIGPIPTDTVRLGWQLVISPCRKTRSRRQPRQLSSELVQALSIWPVASFVLSLAAC